MPRNRYLRPIFDHTTTQPVRRNLLLRFTRTRECCKLGSKTYGSGVPTGVPSRDVIDVALNKTVIDSDDSENLLV